MLIEELRRRELPPLFTMNDGRPCTAICGESAEQNIGYFAEEYLWLTSPARKVTKWRRKKASVLREGASQRIE